jgi:hypothetical protein
VTLGHGIIQEGTADLCSVMRKSFNIQ